jgi:hypothetical protein
MTPDHHIRARSSYWLMVLPMMAKVCSKFAACQPYCLPLAALKCLPPALVRAHLPRNLTGTGDTGRQST